MSRPVPPPPPKRTGAGRPPIFDNVDDLSAAIDEYFRTAAYVDPDDPKSYSPTVAGLARHLGMSTETLRTYGDEDKFSATVKSAKQRIEEFLERRLAAGGQAAGVIFNLKNNFKWRDRQELGLTDSDGGDLFSGLADAIRSTTKNLTLRETDES